MEFVEEDLEEWRLISVLHLGPSRLLCFLSAILEIYHPWRRKRHLRCFKGGGRSMFFFHSHAIDPSSTTKPAALVSSTREGVVSITYGGISAP